MSLIEQIDNLDRTVTLQINSVHCLWSDHLWQFFSDKEIWFPMYLIVVVCLIVRLGWKRGIVSILTIILVIVCCDQFANLIKDMVGRLRPCRDQWMLEHGIRLLEGKGNMYGFFSAHAANSFAFAVSSTVLFRADTKHKYYLYGTLVYLWAALVSISRIFVGKHYLGDVIVGIIVGILIGSIVSTLSFRATNTYLLQKKRAK